MNTNNEHPVKAPIYANPEPIDPADYPAIGDIYRVPFCHFVSRPEGGYEIEATTREAIVVAHCYSAGNVQMVPLVKCDCATGPLQAYLPGRGVADVEQLQTFPAASLIDGVGSITENDLANIRLVIANLFLIIPADLGGPNGDEWEPTYPDGENPDGE